MPVEVMFWSLRSCSLAVQFCMQSLVYRVGVCRSFMSVRQEEPSSQHTHKVRSIF